jgi:hypothetical protein
MSAEEDLERTTEQMKALFGPPPLVRGESEEQYWKWWEAFVEEYKPKTLSAWVEVNDLANKQWEQGRLRRCNPALIEAALPKALLNLLRPFEGKGVSIATATAHKYYAGNVKEIREARKKVTNCGISDDQILAEAMQMRSSGLIALDRMDNYRSRARRSLLKDIERRSEARRGQPDKSESQNWESN